MKGILEVTGQTGRRHKSSLLWVTQLLSYLIEILLKYYYVSLSKYPFLKRKYRWILYKISFQVQHLHTSSRNVCSSWYIFGTIQPSTHSVCNMRSANGVDGNLSYKQNKVSQRIAIYELHWSFGLVNWYTLSTRYFKKSKTPELN